MSLRLWVEELILFTIGLNGNLIIVDIKTNSKYI